MNINTKIISFNYLRISPKRNLAKNSVSKLMRIINVIYSGNYCSLWLNKLCKNCLCGQKITPVKRLLGVKCDEHLTVAHRLVLIWTGSRYPESNRSIQPWIWKMDFRFTACQNLKLIFITRIFNQNFFQSSDWSSKMCSGQLGTLLRSWIVTVNVCFVSITPDCRRYLSWLVHPKFMIHILWVNMDESELLNG